MILLCYILCCTLILVFLVKCYLSPTLVLYIDPDHAMLLNTSNYHDMNHRSKYELSRANNTIIYRGKHIIDYNTQLNIIGGILLDNHQSNVRPLMFVPHFNLERRLRILTRDIIIYLYKFIQIM